MGTEYKISLAPYDFAAFENEERGTSLDRTLRDGPGFVGRDGEVYLYEGTKRSGDDWNETVQIQDDGLLLVLYSSERLLDYLMKSVLDICGRLEIEEG